MDRFDIYEESSQSVLEATKDFSDYDPHESYVSSSIYIENNLNEKLKEIFEELRESWLYDTAFDSGYKNKINHPAFIKIVAFGEAIIPILIEDMVKNKTFWHYALIDITGENPIRDESKGIANKIIEDWKIWAEENKYV